MPLHSLDDALFRLFPRYGVFLDTNSGDGAFFHHLLRKQCRAYLFAPDHDSETCSRQALGNIPKVVIEWLDVSKKEPGTFSIDDYTARHAVYRADLVRITADEFGIGALGGMRGFLGRVSEQPLIIVDGWSNASEGIRSAVGSQLAELKYRQSDLPELFIPRTERSLLASPEGEAVAPQKRPLVTVCIPTRNRVEPLLNLLSSLVAQSYQEYQVLIGDDGDQFNLDEIIAKSFPDLAFARIDGPRISLPTNRLRLAEHAHTELILMCDDDHVLHPHCLDELVDLMTDSEHIGIVSAVWPHVFENPKTVRFDDIRLCHDYRLDLDEVDEEGDFWWKNGTEAFKAYHTPPRVQRTAFTGGGCVLHRKSAIAAVGGFPKDYSVVSFREDTDFSYRLHLAGYELLLNPRAIADHHCTPTGGSRDIATRNTQQWEKDFTADGKYFLSKLSRWRTKASQLAAIAEEPLRVALVSNSEDTIDRAWISLFRQHLEPDVEVLAATRAEEAAAADLVAVLAENFDPVLAALPPGRTVIIGSSEPARRTKDGETLLYDLLTFEQNDPASAQVLCGPLGVNTSLFTPAAEPTAEFTACFIADPSFAEPGSLADVQEACGTTGTLLFDADIRVRFREQLRNPQAWQQGAEEIRDSLYHRSSVLIATADYRSAEVTALEALACGLAVIARPQGVLQNIIINGYNGWLVDGQPEAITAALLQLQTIDPFELRLRARATVENGWQQNTRRGALLKALREVKRRTRFSDLSNLQDLRKRAEAFAAATVPQETVLPEIDLTLARLLIEQDGRFTYLSRFLFPADASPSEENRSREVWQILPPYYLHFGGTAELESFLASFYPQAPESILVAIGDAAALRPVIERFPRLKQIYFAPMPLSREAISWEIARTSPKCLRSSGAITPLSSVRVETTVQHSRVLIAGNAFWPQIGGVESYLEELALQLQQRGYEVEIATSWCSERTSLSYRNLRIHQFRTNNNLEYPETVAAISGLQQLILNGNYSAVLMLAPLHIWMGVAVLQLPEKRPRTIALPIINPEILDKWRAAAATDHIGHLLRGADSVISITEHGVGRDYLRSQNIEAVYIPHSSDPTIAAPQNARATLGLRTDIPLLTVVANFVEVKNHLGLLEAMSRCRASYQLALAGAPHPNIPQYFEAVCAVAQADSRVKIVGPLERPLAAALIRDADLLLLPSVAEGNPIVILQSMSFKTPWIATPNCNSVHDQAGGVVAEIEGFPRAVEKLLAKQDLCKLLGELGHEHWSRCFAWERTTEAIVQVVEGKSSTFNLSMPDELRQRNTDLVREILS